MDKISEMWRHVQQSLFPHLQECLPEITSKHRNLVLAVETIRIEDYVEMDAEAGPQAQRQTSNSSRIRGKSFIQRANDEVIFG